MKKFSLHRLNIKFMQAMSFNLCIGYNRPTTLWFQSLAKTHLKNNFDKTTAFSFNLTV